MRVCNIENCGRPVNSHDLCDKHDRRRRLYGDPLVTLTRPRELTELPEIFAWYMPGEPPEDGCWLWSGPMGSMGYGQFRFRGQYIGAHVAAHTIFRGEVPEGLVVRHDCDTPLCVQPRHLLLGTHADNQADKVARSRQARGSRIAGSRLTEQDVRRIRERHDAGESYRMLAAAYGVTKGAISHIVTRRQWRHI